MGFMRMMRMMMRRVTMLLNQKKIMVMMAMKVDAGRDAW